jgi:transcriptional regulator with XRE-family HTH domain
VAAAHVVLDPGSFALSVTPPVSAVQGPHSRLRQKRGLDRSARGGVRFSYTMSGKAGRNPRRSGEASVVAERLRRARLRAGVSVTAAAAALGVRRAAIYEMEEGRRRCQAQELFALAELYDVSPTYLLGQRTTRARDDRAERAADALAGLDPDALSRLEKAIRIVKERGRGRSSRPVR